MSSPVYQREDGTYILSEFCPLCKTHFLVGFWKEEGWNEGCLSCQTTQKQDSPDRYAWMQFDDLRRQDIQSELLGTMDPKSLSQAPLKLHPGGKAAETQLSPTGALFLKNQLEAKQLEAQKNQKKPLDTLNEEAKGE